MFNSTFLRTRVARRVFALFLLSALVPTGVLAGIAYYQVTRQLTEQSADGLRTTSKMHGQALQERLGFATSDLRSAAARVPVVAGSLRDSVIESLALGHPRFARLAATAAYEDGVLSLRWEHLRTGKPILAASRAGEGPQLLLGLALEPSDPAAGILWAEIRPDYLWASADNRVGETGSSLCVVREGEPLYCEVPIPGRALESLSTAVTSLSSARVAWKDADGEDHLAARWDMFLRHEYQEATWTVVTAMSVQDVLAPAARFKVTFILSLLLSLAIVFVLSNIQIRRSLEPLRELREGTRRISASDFDVCVPVATNDEFGELASAFNRMAKRLSRQFTALNAASEVDRAILSSFDTSQISETVLAGVTEIAGSDTATLSLMLEEEGVARSMTLAGGAEASRLKVEREVLLTSGAASKLKSHPEEFWIEGTPGDLDCLTSTNSAMSRHLVLPIWLDGDVAGWLALGYAAGSECDSEQRAHGRQLADQLAVALSNARLVERLDELNWGTIQALARTIDAKSRWTAGHSERVTENALALGNALGIKPDKLELIKRGGLLHDIGKIGVPTGILDKPSRLTEEEFDIVRQHPTIGARILEPVRGLEDVLDIVKYHHERIDGAGYPEALSGEDIPYLARVLSVADVWDSLRSARPYREALTPELTARIMREGDGTQFDSEILEVFLSLVVPRMERARIRGTSGPVAVAAEPEESRHAV